MGKVQHEGEKAEKWFNMPNMLRINLGIWLSQEH